MIAWGLSKDDLAHLERLSDAKVIKALPPNKRYLRHNQRDDVVLYLNTWADLLELELVKLPLSQGIGAEALVGIKV